MNAAVSKLKKDIWKTEELPEEGKTGEVSASERVIAPKAIAASKTDNPKYIRVTSRKRNDDELMRMLRDQRDKRLAARAQKTDAVKELRGESQGAGARAQKTDAVKELRGESQGAGASDKTAVLTTLETESLSEALANSQMMMPMQQTAVSKIRRSIFQLPISDPHTQYYPPEPAEVQNGLALAEQNQSGRKEEKPSPSTTTSSRSRTKYVHLDKTKFGSKPATTHKNAGRAQAAATNTTGDSSGSAEKENREAEARLVLRENQESEGGTGSQGGGEEASAAGTEKKELQRMRGFFFCHKCKKTWKSLHVYCEPGTKKVVYGQLCEYCKVEVMPKRVTKLRCVTCDQTECDCEVKRHVLLEPKLMHRQDLCVKCRAGDPCL